MMITTRWWLSKLLNVSYFHNVLMSSLISLLAIAGSLDAIKDLMTESTIMKTFHHPNVLPLLGVCIDYDNEDVLKIVIPFMVNGDLKKFLKNNRVAPNNIHEYPKVTLYLFYLVFSNMLLCC